LKCEARVLCDIRQAQLRHYHTINPTYVCEKASTGYMKLEQAIG
jgi:hypothetical protein